LKRRLTYGPIYSIIELEKEITAAYKSANSNMPAQVVAAPTQRINPHR